MRSSTSRRQSRRIAGVAAVAALAVVIAGCSSTKNNTPQGQPLPGLTSNSIKVGLTIVDLGALAKALGFVQPDYGGVQGQTKAINAVVAWINANGGMGGRQVTADIKPYLGSGDSPEQSQAQCSAYTQDDKVTAVVLDGGFQTNAVPCYKSANTLVADETLIAHDATQFDVNSPYLYSPTHPEYGAFMKSQLAAMNAAKFFDGNSGVLLMPVDDSVSRRTTDTIVKPYLSSIGVTKVQVSYVDGTNTGTLGQTSSAALIAGKNAKLNRVIVIGGARIEPVVLSDQNAKGYNSTWSISTYDNPIFMQNNPNSIQTELRNGMVGLGYMPAQDLVGNDVGPAFPDTTNPMQVKCTDIINKAGATPPGNIRSNWKQALLYCDGLMFLKAAFDKLPGAATVTAAQFGQAVSQIGDTYRSSLTFGAAWGPNNMYAGTNAAAPLFWDASKNVYDYSGPSATFGPVAAVPGASSAPTSVAPGGTPGGTVPLATVTAAAQ